VNIFLEMVRLVPASAWFFNKYFRLFNPQRRSGLIKAYSVYVKMAKTSFARVMVVKPEELIVMTLWWIINMCVMFVVFEHNNVWSEQSKTPSSVKFEPHVYDPHIHISKNLNPHTHPMKYCYKLEERQQATHFANPKIRNILHDGIY
jgi:hypothetical protein